MPPENKDQETIRNMLVAAQELQGQEGTSDPPPSQGPEDNVPADVTPLPLEDVTPLASPEPEPEPTPAPEPVPEPVPEPAPVVAAEPEPTPTPTPAPEPEVDYKAAYTDMLEYLQQQQAVQGGIPSSWPSPPPSPQALQPQPLPPQGYPQPYPPPAYPQGQQPQGTPPQPPMYPQQQQQIPEAISLINEQQWTGWGENHTAANDVLNNVLNHSVQMSTRMLLPMIISHVQRIFAQNAVREKFFAKNEDLKEHADYTVMETNRVHAENPGWDANKIFNEAAKRVRAKLFRDKGQARPAGPEPSPTPPPSGKPPAPARPGARRTTPQLTVQQTDIRGIMNLQ